MITRGLEQRRQQRVLVLAIAVSVVQHVGGGVWLKSPYSERKADVTKIGSNKIVERLDLFQIAGLALGKLGRFGANLRRRLTAVFLQRCIPATHLFPAGKSSHLHGRNIGFLSRVLLFLFIFFLFRFVLVDVRTGPGVNTTAIALGDFRIIARLGFQLDGPVFGDIEGKLFIENRAGFRKVVFHPELRGRERCLSDGDELIFQLFSRTQPRHRNVLLPIVGINGSISFERNA